MLQQDLFVQDGTDERQRLLREYAALTKTRHRVTGARLQRHNDIPPEWIMRVVEEPHDKWEQIMPNGEIRTMLVGRVPQFNQWLKIVLTGTGDAGELHTAYADRRLEKGYGGRPWREIQ